MKGGTAMRRNSRDKNTHYASLNRSDVPQGRKGRHRKAVADILADLSKLNPQQAVKVPISSLNGEKMQNLRSALNRVTGRETSPWRRRATRSFCTFGVPICPRLREQQNSKVGQYSIVENHVEQRTVYLQSAFYSAGVLNETQLSEPVNEEADSRTSGPNHIGQGFLTYFRDYGLGH